MGPRAGKGEREVSFEEGRYALGLRWYEPGSTVEEGLDIKCAAMGPLSQLRDRAQLTCHLDVLEGARPLPLTAGWRRR